MSKITFILGGIKSGKSNYALKAAKQLKQRTVFIATATGLDCEMKKRIRLHQKFRPSDWKTIEEQRDIDLILPKLSGKYKVIIIDCLGLLISNFLAASYSQKKIESKIKKLISAIKKTKAVVYVVSNEVGLSLVSDNPLGRKFQDLIGLTNQLMAKCAGEVVFMVSGIPIKIK